MFFILFYKHYQVLLITNKKRLKKIFKATTVALNLLTALR